MNDLVDVNNQPSTISASNAVFNPQALNQLTTFANLMADSTISVPAHFVGKPADCMAVVMQAMQWGMNPYAVAQKTHVINGVLGYEAQLVNAVISSSNVIVGRFHYEYAGDWSKCTKTKEVKVQKPAKGGGTYEKTERVKAWSDSDEEGLTIRVGARLRGENEITWCEPIHLSGIVVRNSPLWVTNPKQQMAYLGVKYWGRLYCPEVILGVYTPDEFEPVERTERDITPASTTTDLNNMISNASLASGAVAEPGENADLVHLLSALVDGIDSVESAEVTGNKITEHKDNLTESTFRSLRARAVKAYKHHDARRQIEAAINSLDASAPDAKETFLKVEADLQRLKGQLGDDLHEGFSITLADMKAEYV
ncbi:recombinase RecT [Pantoea sp. B623]|uniref:RecT family recombinase n=1 Tax=Pantoea sp. B623 TaxID=2974561 RepID=UPI00216A6FAB|nr:RecT family recombinase [Pantoea sp. B623]MCS4496227.1 recombinase RecT [Pantoea sp. B623]